MKVRAQIAMVLNLDKCIGCHTCSITCKNVWTSREGVEYAWFNNVETKPGVGYPKEWENQDKWNGGWVRAKSGKLVPRAGGRWRMLAKIFANPDLPQIDDYYEPFDFDYQHLHEAPDGKHQPTARPRSLISGERMQKIHWGPNWEEILGTEFAKRSKDKNFDNVQKEIYGTFEKTFMMYLPRLCEHCLNPACVSACPSGAIYKREEDGIVLIDQDKCRGWRMCVSACPYKKIYYNWKSGKSEKCIFCYPRIEMGEPTVCSETCVGRIRYLGVMLYDADRIAEAAAVPSEKDLYQAHLDIFLDPFDPKVIEAARKEGIPDNWLEAAKQSPVYKLAIDWKLALPLHPEYRTLPMVWYVPPLSPIQSAAERGHVGMNGDLPDVASLRIPVRYLANLLTAGDERPVVRALERLLAMRAWRRAMNVDGVEDVAVLEQAGLTVAQAEDMYRYLAIANYEDRFVIPTAHREYANDAFGERGGCGFSWGNGCGGDSPADLFSQRKTTTYAVHPNRQEKREVVEMSWLKLVGVLMDYPQDELWQHGGELLEAADDPILPAPRRAALADFVRELLAADPLDAQERWLAMFDRGRSMSLLLFEHIHGESRDRGQAMVDLVAAYRKNGFELAAKELPDYLPLVLEYLSQRPSEEARDWLHHVGHIVSLLAARATERESPYALLFEILAEHAEAKFDTGVLRRRAREEPRDDTAEAMDRVWEEEAVRFGAEMPKDDCSPNGRAPERGAASQRVQP